MRNPLAIRRSLLALALALAATTAFAAPPAKAATPSPTAAANVDKAAPATTTKAAVSRPASGRMSYAKSHKRCAQRNKIGHCKKWMDPAKAVTKK